MDYGRDAQPTLSSDGDVMAESESNPDEYRVMPKPIGEPRVQPMAFRY